MPPSTPADKLAGRLDYRIRYSARAKHLRMVVRADDAEVVAPRGTPRAACHAFARAKREWALARQTELRAERQRRAAQRRPLRTGGALPYRGREVPLEVATPQDARDGAVSGGQCRLSADRLRIDLPAGTPAAQREQVAAGLARQWLSARTAEAARGAVGAHAPALGCWPAGLRVKDQRSRWGSCGVRGVVHLNWRLAMAPPAVLEYVVVHELCHLRRRDHSPTFWGLVAALMPDYERHRRWLTTQGRDLFALL